VIVEGREEAKRAAGQERAGLTIFVDGSRVESVATGYAVVWKKKGREGWASIKAHMGFNQEAFDAECAALARALEVAARRKRGGRGNNNSPPPPPPPRKGSPFSRTRKRR